MPNQAGRGFEWDAAKANANVRKHGIDFADVTSVFQDDRAITIQDVITLVDEQRYITVGRDDRGRVVVVAWTWRGSNVRIFSARKGTPRERREYRENG